jgi:hypothetical protein
MFVVKFSNILSKDSSVEICENQCQCCQLRVLAIFCYGEIFEASVTAINNKWNGYCYNGVTSAVLSSVVIATFFLVPPLLTLSLLFWKASQLFKSWFH